MNRTKEELLRRHDVSRDELERRLIGDLDMIIGYLRHVVENMRCARGEHDWMSWSAHFCGNVKETDLLGDDVFCYRSCRHCGQEMPESRHYHQKDIKEKNAITLEEFKKTSEYKGLD